jgi:hypothetical protein
MNISSPSKAKSLAVRKSLSTAKPTNHDRQPSKSPADFDMAEQMNEEISNKYVKGPSLHQRLSEMADKSRQEVG